MKLVIIESPYAGDIEANTIYARKCLMDSLRRGEAPLASHLLYPQVLIEDIPEERQWGIDAGLAWRSVCDYAIFYVDKGWSNGMKVALKTYVSEYKAVKVRRLDMPDVDDIARHEHLF